MTRVSQAGTTAEASFPIAGPGAEMCALLSVKCTTLTDDAVTNVLPNDLKKFVRQIVEPLQCQDSPEVANVPVQVIINKAQPVDGTSFGLAIVIAHKRARHLTRKQLEDTEFIATGTIDHQELGRVRRVDALVEKLEFIYSYLAGDNAPKHTVVVVPAENTRNSSVELSSQLNRIRTLQTVTVHEISNVDELGRYWKLPPVIDVRRRRLWPILAGGAALAATVAAAVFWYSIPSLRDHCITGSLELSDSSSIKTFELVESQCEQASVDDPTDVDIHLALARLHLKANMREAAIPSLRRAADLGDPEATAALGEHLRLEEGGSDTDLEAYERLRTAALAGNCDAAISLAWLLLEGRVGQSDSAKEQPALVKRLMDCDASVAKELSLK